MTKKNFKSKMSNRSDQQRMRIEEARHKLWTQRIVLVKRGAALVKFRRFVEAVNTYEKYLKILEFVCDCKSGKLTPQLFKDTSQISELSIITGVYWDLVRIYDTNPAYLRRQKAAAEQVVKFVQFTPLKSEITNRALTFQKNCRQPDVIKKLILEITTSKTRCFIATAAFNSAGAVEVQVLRHYRDETLRNSYWGRQFIFYYYKYSPTIACFIDKHAHLKAPLRFILRFVIKCVT